MNDPGRRLREIYSGLRRRNGPQGWWPGRTPFEVVVGAILTQNTAWGNVEKAIGVLRARRMLSLRAMRAAPEGELALLVRSSGTYRQKARKLKAFIAWLDGRHAGSVARAARVATPALRAEILSIWGIGPETADSILLYAFGRPVFVVDAYAHRILRRHDLHPGGGYEQVRAFLERTVPRRVELYNDFHAQLVWVGHHYCRSRPRCEGCPLEPLLPGRRGSRGTGGTKRWAR